MEIVFDFGNKRVKYFLPRANQFSDFEHAIAPLSETDWRNIAGRSGKPPDGIIKVNGLPYAVGRAAMRYTIQEKPKGAARYNETYYGVGLAYAMAEGISHSDDKVFLQASHAPVDVAYASTLAAAARQTFNVEYRRGAMTFNVVKVGVFDEPLGGYAHYAFTEKGLEKKNNPLLSKTSLVIDVGGYTTDVVAVDPGGEIDLLSLHSTRTGVIGLISQFEAELRANNRKLFQDTGDIDIERIESAIRNKKFQFGNIAIDCVNEASAAINSLVNDVVQVINQAGGVANFDVMLLTGGGSALIYEALVQAMPRIRFLMADPHRDYMKFANVFGGAKISAMIRRMKEWQV